MIKKYFNLKGLVYIAIVAMPLYLFKIVIFGVPSNIFEMLALITTFLYLSSAVSLNIELRGYRKYFIPITLIIGGLALSTIFSGFYELGAGIIKGWFIIPIIFSWICIGVLKNGKDMLRSVYFSAFIVACLSLIYFFIGKVTFDGRLQVFYNSPNFLAMYLAPAIIIGTSLIKEHIKFYSVSLLIILGSFYLTQSYAAWLAVFSALLVLALVKNEIFKWRKVTILFLAIGLFLFFQLGTGKMDRLIGLERRSSLSSRTMIWSSALKIGLDNPIVGIGPGNFQNKYLEYQKYYPPYLEWAVPQPHNLFLAVWLQAGILGVVGFCWLIIIWIKDFLAIERRQKEDYIYLGILLYILIHGLVDTTYFKNDLAVVFWLIIFAIKKRPLLKSALIRMEIID